MARCIWCNENDKEYIAYHDNEWGVPIYDECRLFELLILECFQAGLSWACVLHKRPAFRKAFDNFNVGKVASYTDEKLETLLQNPDIIRNRLKINAAVINAKIFIKIQQEYGSFTDYIWSWTNGETLLAAGNITRSDLSDKISKDLIKRGMKFTGSTVIYAYLCAAGIIFAHDQDCFIKYKKKTN